MDTESLKNKRQLNVQEQNILLKDKIEAEAKFWRENGIPLGLISALTEKGIDIDTSIFLNYEQDFPGCSTDEGIVVTKDKRFFEFEMDLMEDRNSLSKLYVWKELTENTEINEHKPGTGATWGFLAIEVMTELNNF